jgi:hypothetical protein
MAAHETGSREQWLTARLELLEAKKELTRRSDELARRRQQLPWVTLDKDYLFDMHEGRRSLRDLFAERSQLLIYHFMFGPDWSEGCPACSFWADGFDRAIVHLNHRDVTMLCASLAPLSQLGVRSQGEPIIDCDRQQNPCHTRLCAPGRTRTCDPLLRRQPLYPAELRRRDDVRPFLVRNSTAVYRGEGDANEHILSLSSSGA